MVTETDARLVVRTLRGLLGDDMFPEAIFNLNGRNLVTLDEAKARYQASMDWFDETNLLVISNGPYYLTRYDPPAQFAQVDAFRAEGYPFKPGDWAFGEPPALTVDIEPPPPVALGDAVSVPVSVSGPGALSVHYALVDPSSADPETTIVAGGEASGDNGSFTIDIASDVTSTLFPSVYQLYVLAASDELARVAERAVDLPVGV
jgi:peptide/nickel transport system substrate-binding protein